MTLLTSTWVVAGTVAALEVKRTAARGRCHVDVAHNRGDEQPDRDQVPGEHGDRCIWVSILAPDPAQKDVAALRRQHLDYVAIFDLAIT